MIQLVFIIFLIASFVVMACLFWKKIPTLSELAEIKNERKESLFVQLRNKVKSLSFFRSFSWDGILLKTLSKTRVIVLKIEKKVSDYLQSLRERSQRKKK